MFTEKFIILDVEGMSNKRPYNIGYIVADRNDRIYEKRSIAFCECIFENLIDVLEKNAIPEMKVACMMTKKNIQEILMDNGKKYQKITINGFYRVFKKSLQRYNVKKMFAYNAVFDNSALKRLLGGLYDELEIQICDIWTGITYARLLTPNYLEWCKINGFITEKGNYKTNAETVYKYLFGDMDFTEEHTGLADVMIEYQILLKALKKNETRFDQKQPWRMLKKYEESLE